MKLRKTPVRGRASFGLKTRICKILARIIPVISGVIGGRETNIVSARTLHNALGVGRDFTNWIKGRIEEYGFKKGVDFEVVKYLTHPIRRAQNLADSLLMITYSP